MEEFIIFVLAQILLAKFFSLNLSVRGVSKALLIDFFSFSLQTILICQVENPFKTDVNVKKFIEYLIE